MDSVVNTQNLSIVIIEDDILVSRLLKMRLSKYYSNITVYSNGIEGFEAVKEGEGVDLVILDVMLPGMQGFEILEKLKKSSRSSHIKVIMLTAKSREEDINRGFDLGADEYISKPFNINELLFSVHKQLN